MKVYLDVSCLNRPFDDQHQSRIRLESEAVTLIIEKCQRGEWQQISSGMAVIEIDAMADAEKQSQVRALLPDSSGIRPLSQQEFDRAAELQTIGMKPADALHVAAAEAAQVDVLLSCDDRLCRVARRNAQRLLIRVMNPVEWLREVDDATDA